MTVFEITHLCAIEGDGIRYSRRRERWTYCTNQNWDNNKTSKGPCDTKNTSRNRTGRAISITDLRKKKKATNKWYRSLTKVMWLIVIFSCCSHPTVVMEINDHQNPSPTPLLKEAGNSSGFCFMSCSKSLRETKV